MRWVHPEDKGKDNPTVFWIVPLTEGQSRKLKAANPTFFSKQGVEIDNNALMRDLFMQNVVKIEGVHWPGGGEAVTIETVEDKARFLECLPVAYAGEIYTAIQNTGALDEGAVGN